MKGDGSKTEEKIWLFRILGLRHVQEGTGDLGCAKPLQLLGTWLRNTAPWVIFSTLWILSLNINLCLEIYSFIFNLNTLYQKLFKRSKIKKVIKDFIFGKFSQASIRKLKIF